MSGQFDVTELVAIPLTPIHVGGGEESALRPEAYRLKSGMLEVFSLHKVFDMLPDREKLSAMEMILKDPFRGLNRIRDRVPAEAVLERIALAEESEKELRSAISPPADTRGRRNGTVLMFQRAGGRPLLPGSSIKGAFRTGWLARCSQGIEVPAGGSSSERHHLLQSRAFALADGKTQTDTDPMRDVTVADAVLPFEATRIDRIRTWKRVSEGGKPIWGIPAQEPQLHWERTRSVVDGGEPPTLTLSIGVRSSATVAARRAVDRPLATPTRSPASVAVLFSALNEHHWPLWRREAEEKFFAGDPGARLREALATFSHLQIAGEDPDAALVRIGRGGHAESKSVEWFREIYRPQAKTQEHKYTKEGSTRHVLNIAGAAIPFGWMLLIRADRYRAPGKWLALPTPAMSTPNRSDPSPEPPSREGASLLFRRGDAAIVDGEPVTIEEDVLPGAREVNVRFGTGDTEPVRIEDIKTR